MELQIWNSMESYGITWIPVAFLGIPWNPMGFYRLAWNRECGIPWDSMGFHAIPWNPSSGIPSNPMTSHGIPWHSKTGIPWDPMGIHGIPWDPSSGIPWNPMESDGIPGLGSRGIPWDSVEFHGLCRVHGFNGIPLKKFRKALGKHLFFVISRQNPPPRLSRRAWLRLPESWVQVLGPSPESWLGLRKTVFRGHTSSRSFGPPPQGLSKTHWKSIFQASGSF